MKLFLHLILSKINHLRLSFQIYKNWSKKYSQYLYSRQQPAHQPSAGPKNIFYYSKSVPVGNKNAYIVYYFYFMMMVVFESCQKQKKTVLCPISEEAESDLYWHPM